MPKALGDATRIERVDGIRGKVGVGLGHEEGLSGQGVAGRFNGSGAAEAQRDIYNASYNRCYVCQLKATSECRLRMRDGPLGRTLLKMYYRCTITSDPSLRDPFP